MSVQDVPDFLVIGAQKCGTTTLYEDLRAHPNINILEKESSWLLEDPGSSATRGSKPFDRPPGHLTGEVSTKYSMLPLIDAVGAAKNRLRTVKVIYIVRDPVARVVSHHHHHLAAGLVDPDINVAVRECAELVDNSRYATQIRPWMDAFGAESVRVVKFEDYVSDRAEGSRSLHSFLGVEAIHLPGLDVAHNISTEKRVATGAWARLRSTPAYRQGLRKVLPESMRRKITHRVLPAPIERPEAPTPDTLEWLVTELAAEVTGLASLLEELPWWDLEAIYLTRSSGS